MAGDTHRPLIAWLAILVVCLGTAIPLSVYCWFERGYKKGEIVDLTWEEGFGFIAWVACLVPFVLCQVGALALAWQSRGLFPARAAGFAAIGLLITAVIFHTWAFWADFGGCWAFISGFISGFISDCWRRHRR